MQRRERERERENNPTLFEQLKSRVACPVPRGRSSLAFSARDFVNRQAKEAENKTPRDTEEERVREKKRVGRR